MFSHFWPWLIFLHVLTGCNLIYDHVWPSLTMLPNVWSSLFHHVLLCFTMFKHVQICLKTMFNYVLTWSILVTHGLQTWSNMVKIFKHGKMWSKMVINHVQTCSNMVKIKHFTIFYPVFCYNSHSCRWFNQRDNDEEDLLAAYTSRSKHYKRKLRKQSG